MRSVYSKLVDKNVERKTWEYTRYILTLGESIFSKVAEEKGIDVNREVRFEAAQNGVDSEGHPNGQYTIIGIIQ